MDLSLTQERLDEAFGPRLQISPSALHPYLLFVEEKVGSSQEALGAALRDKNLRQTLIRADARRLAAEQRVVVMQISRTPRITCECGGEVALAVMENREVVCGKCAKAHRASYWPVPDRLISHFQMSDPARRDQAYRVRKEDQAAAFREVDERRMLASETGHAYGDALIEQIPAARLSGRTGMWIQE